MDGVVRDLAEIRASGFPVFARGVVPKPGTKKAAFPLNEEIRCGGVTVRAGDLVVADEEGVVVVPATRQDELLQAARAKAAKEAAQSLDAWETDHYARIQQALDAQGFTG